MRIAYFYLMRNDPSNVGIAAPLHKKYWDELNLNHYVGGPFVDFSGGLITFEVENIQQAQEIVNDDPFVVEDLLEQSWVKQWMS